MSYNPTNILGGVRLAEARKLRAEDPEWEKFLAPSGDLAHTNSNCIFEEDMFGRKSYPYKDSFALETERLGYKWHYWENGKHYDGVRIRSAYVREM